MSFRISASLFGVALALTVTAASAEEVNLYTANFLLPYCKMTETYERIRDLKTMGLASYCLGAVQGMASVLNGSTDVVWCADIPAVAPAAQLVRVVVRYIEARPQEMHRHFIDLAAHALVDAWPCKKGRN